MAAPAAAPEVPALAALLVSMAAALAWAASTGLLQVWRRSLGKLLVWMADNLDKVGFKIATKTVRPLAPLAAMLRSLVYTVDHYLGEAAIWSGNAAATFFHFFLTLNLWMAREIADLASDTFHALKAQSVTTFTDARTYVDGRVYKPIKKETVYITKTSTAALKALNHRVDVLARRVAHLTAHAAVASAGAVAAPWPRIRGLERRATNQAKRLTRLEKVSAVGVGVVAAALARLGIGWVRCRNVQKIGKRACGLDTDLLESLLGGLLLIFGTVSLLDLTRGVQEVTDEVTAAGRAFIREASVEDGKARPELGLDVYNKSTLA